MQVTLPAATLRHSLSEITPLPLEIENRYVKGKLFIDSIEKLEMQGDVIRLQGVLGGHNVGVTSKVAGRDIRLKLGEVKMPVTCDLYLRFDRQAQQLYVTPRFSARQKKKNDPAAALAALFDAIAGKEYPLDLRRLLPFTTQIGNQSILIYMQLIAISAKDNLLQLQLLPKPMKMQTLKTAGAPTQQ
jgi:hypothetical protein